jgi:hypothetical protein
MIDDSAPQATEPAAHSDQPEHETGQACSSLRSDAAVAQYLHLIPNEDIGEGENKGDAKVEEIKTAPLFTQAVKTAIANGDVLIPDATDDLLQQYGLLGLRKQVYHSRNRNVSSTLSTGDNLVFANMNAPWSTFICGSQGAGKSHTLSCILENSLLTSSPAGNNPQPLAGLIFHYDHFTGTETTQLCEAAYLCSAGIPVRVLVSPSNLHNMRRLYRNLPGLSAGAPRPQVMPMYLQEQQLTVARMTTLMAVQESREPPLYIEVLFKVLREMSMENKGSGGLDYLEFKRRLDNQGFFKSQVKPLKMRLDLLESFLAHPRQPNEAAARLKAMYESAEGTLTIVDLSCPFVNGSEACALFSICLSIFMENRGQCGRVVALDEAHKVCSRHGPSLNASS